MSTRRAARALHRKGILTIPAPPRAKAPTISGWQTLRPEERDIDWLFADDDNVGILLGEPSGWIVDVDLDCHDAIELAPHFLPKTVSTGRQSKPDSHAFVRSIGAVTKQFRDDAGCMIVEIRSTGAQTIVPPSIHPSGERYEWGPRRDLVEIAAADLYNRVAGLASTVMLVRYGLSVDEARDVIDRRVPLALPEPIESRIRRWLTPNEAPRVERTRTVTSDDDLDSRIRRATAYVDRMPSAISGQGGHAATFAVALVLIRGFELPHSEALTLLRDYNERCQPKWSERELLHKLKSAENTKHDKAPPFGYLLEERAA